MLNLTIGGTFSWFHGNGANGTGAGATSTDIRPGTLGAPSSDLPELLALRREIKQVSNA